MTDIDIHGDALAASTVRALTQATIDLEGSSPSRVSISFTDEPAIRELNRQHRGKDRATDVLSFPFDGSFPQGSGGEVIICPAVVQRLAEADGREPLEALKETVVHGVLHLLGHRDDTSSGAQGMERQTRRILETA